MAKPQTQTAAKTTPPKTTPPASVVRAVSGDLVHAQMPEYLAQMDKASGRGSENVTVSDIVIPRLEIVQALSPCKKKSDPTYIEGAEDGMLYNNVTRELYGDEVLVMPIYFRKEFLIWVDRKEGDGSIGFRGAFDTADAAAQKITELDEDHLQIIDTGQQFCMLVHSEGRVEEVVISMARSKMKVSRRWNSLIRLAGGDRWSRVYKITTVEEKGKKGEYANFAVDVFGFPSKALFDSAAKKYDSVKSGRVVADISGLTINPDDDNSQDGTARSKRDDY